MSFWDTPFTPGTPGTSTPPTRMAEQPSPTLNDEVTEVIGQLERFWGGFRKQGQSAIQAARKDLGDYVSQAQKGINQQLTGLSVSTPVPATDADAQSLTASSSTRDLTDSITTDGDGESSGSSSTSASTATLPDPQQQPQQPERAQSPTQNLLTRLQSSIPPDLLTTLRDTIPDRVRDPQVRMDLAHAAQTRVQGAAARGEEILRGASVFLRDAVRVVPPDPEAASTSAAPLAREGDSKSAAAAIASTPATRRGVLLRALRSNPAILRVDPAGEERSAILFVRWVETGLDTASDESRRESELTADDGMLGSTLAALVPGELSEDVFWIRYFFRVYQINQEDEQRKAVLSAGPTDQDDDFSWEDEEEDSAPKIQPSLSLPTAPPLNREGQRSANTTGSMSPQRSDDSFDIVSSGRASAVGDVGAVPVNVKETSDGDDEDDDDDDEDEDEDGDEEESDWE